MLQQKYVAFQVCTLSNVPTRQFQTRSQPLQEPKGTHGAEDGGESRGDDAMGAVLSLSVISDVGVGGGGAEALGDVVAVLTSAETDLCVGS